MDSEPAVLENVRPSEPRFVPQETVPATARYLLSQKPAVRVKHTVGLLQHSPPALLHGVQPDATCGDTEDVATILSADEGGEEPVGG